MVCFEVSQLCSSHGLYSLIGEARQKVMVEGDATEILAPFVCFKSSGAMQLYKQQWRNEFLTASESFELGNHFK